MLSPARESEGEAAGTADGAWSGWVAAGEGDDGLTIGCTGDAGVTTVALGVASSPSRSDTPDLEELGAGEAGAGEAGAGEAGAGEAGAGEVGAGEARTGEAGAGEAVAEPAGWALAPPGSKVRLRAKHKTTAIQLVKALLEETLIANMMITLSLHSDRKKYAGAAKGRCSLSRASCEPTPPKGAFQSI
jgi:hypothetical protein